MITNPPIFKPGFGATSAAPSAFGATNTGMSAFGATPAATNSAFGAQTARMYLCIPKVTYLSRLANSIPFQNVCSRIW